MSRTRGLIWLVAGLFIALIAGLLAYQYMNRAAAVPSEQAALQGAATTVVVVARNVAVRTQLVADDLTTVDFPGVPPAGAVTSLDAAVGMLTTADLFEGEIVLADRLLDPTVVAPDGRMALMMVEDEVLVAIPAVDVLSHVHVLKPGDHVDILASLDLKAKTPDAATGATDDVQSTFALLQNVTIAGLLGEGVAPRVLDTATAAVEEVAEAAVPDPQAVLLTLSPQDALALKYTIDAGGKMDLVLRAPGVDRPFETDAVDADYIEKRYELPLEPGQ